MYINKYIYIYYHMIWSESIWSNMIRYDGIWGQATLGYQHRWTLYRKPVSRLWHLAAPCIQVARGTTSMAHQYQGGSHAWIACASACMRIFRSVLNWDSHSPKNKTMKPDLPMNTGFMGPGLLVVSRVSFEIILLLGGLSTNTVSLGATCHPAMHPAGDDFEETRRQRKAPLLAGHLSIYQWYGWYPGWHHDFPPHCSNFHQDNPRWVHYKPVFMLYFACGGTLGGLEVFN